jgi:hypothetical protein
MRLVLRENHLKFYNAVYIHTVWHFFFRFFFFVFLYFSFVLVSTITLCTAGYNAQKRWCGAS